MKTNATFHFDRNVSLKILLLIGFSVFFLYTIATGTVSLYVHPRIVPFMIFAAVVMIMIALLFFCQLFHFPQKKSSIPLLFFVIPLIMAFVLPARSFDSSTGTVGKVQLSGLNKSTKSTSNSISEAVSSDNSDKKSSAFNDLTLQDGVLVITSDNYYDCLNTLYADRNKFQGLKVEVTGFVFHDSENFNENEFVPARLMMTCCAADMVPVGLICQFGKASELVADEWVKVTGTIGKTEFDGETVPCIMAVAVEHTEKPDNEYIYPY